MKDLTKETLEEMGCYENNENSLPLHRGWSIPNAMGIHTVKESHLLSDSEVRLGNNEVTLGTSNTTPVWEFRDNEWRLTYGKNDYCISFHRFNPRFYHDLLNENLLIVFNCSVVKCPFLNKYLLVLFIYFSNYYFAGECGETSLIYAKYEVSF